MNDVMKKRLIGVAILVIIGVLTPLLLSHCMHSGSGDQDNGRGSMRVYDVQPDGQTKPADNGNNSGNGEDADQGGSSSNAGDGDQGQPPPQNPDAVSPQSQSHFSTPPVHGQSDQSGAASNGDNAGNRASQNQQSSKPAPSSSRTPTRQKPSASPRPTEHGQSSSHDYGASTSASHGSSSQSASNSGSDNGASGGEKSSIHGWVIQVASFGKRENAADMVNKLKGQFQASYTPGDVNGKTWYRVNVGPFDNEQDARSAAARLEKAGHKGLVRNLP